MPIVVAAIIGGLIEAAASMVGRVLIALGIGFVSYQGISTALDTLKTYAVNNLNALPAGISWSLHVFKVDTALSMIFSAIVARLVIMGLTSGTIKRMVHK
jgi:hypothetical protein